MGKGEKIILTTKFFRRDQVELTDTIRKVTWQFITENGELQNRNTISAKLESAVTPGMFNNLKIGWKIAKKKFHTQDAKGSSLENFIQNKIRGSKKFREVLNKKRKKIAEKEITKLTQVKLYANLTGIENIPITRVRGMLGAWNNFFLLGKIFTFLFKFYNNSLGLNSRVAKFNNTVDPGCTVLFVV